MLDEPTNGLDIASSRAVRNVIYEIRDQRRCVLFSSHIMSEVEALCDRITVICDGLIVANGTLEELRQVHGPAQPGRGFFGGGHPGCDSYMRNVWIVFQKERICNLRDRRSIILALIYPIIGTLHLGLLISFVGGRFRGQSQSALPLPVAGADQAIGGWPLFRKTVVTAAARRCSAASGWPPMARTAAMVPAR